MSDASRARVMVVEDDAAIRNALQVALRMEGFDVRAESDADAATEAVSTFRPHLAILDVNLPGDNDGFGIGRLLHAQGIPFLFLTGADSPHDRIHGFDLGAEDYVGKPFVMGELVRRVRARLRATGRLRRHVVGDLVIDDLSQSVTRGGTALDVSGREFDILLMLARRPGHCVSKEMLLRQLWGEEYLDLNLVEAKVSVLRRKLEDHGPRLIHTRRGFGYELRP